MYEEIRKQARNAAIQFCEMSSLKKGQIAIIGCSTSEIIGERMGTHSVPEVANAVFEEIFTVLSERGVFLAAQCCEHLNRAIIVEREAVLNAEIVNVVPQPKAGGSFATAAYVAFKDPVALEEIKADAGLDVGGTLIGMHLRKVAVPLKLSIRKIGEANVTAARTRPKFIGGSRAVYEENIL